MFGWSGVLRRHHQSPARARKPAGQDPKRAFGALRGRTSDAPFPAEVQFFLNFLIAVFLPVAFCLNVYLDVLFTAITPIPATAALTTGALFKGAKAAVVRMCLGMIHGVVQRVTQRSYTTLSPKRKLK